MILSVKIPLFIPSALRKCIFVESSAVLFVIVHIDSRIGRISSLILAHVADVGTPTCISTGERIWFFIIHFIFENLFVCPKAVICSCIYRFSSIRFRNGLFKVLSFFWSSKHLSTWRVLQYSIQNQVDENTKSLRDVRLSSLRETSNWKNHVNLASRARSTF